MTGDGSLAVVGLRANGAPIVCDMSEPVGPDGWAAILGDVYESVLDEVLEVLEVPTGVQAGAATAIVDGPSEWVDR